MTARQLLDSVADNKPLQRLYGDLYALALDGQPPQTDAEASALLYAMFCRSVDYLSDVLVEDMESIQVKRLINRVNTYWNLLYDRTRTEGRVFYEENAFKTRFLAVAGIVERQDRNAPHGQTL